MMDSSRALWINPGLSKDEIFEAVDRVLSTYYLRPKPFSASLEPCWRTKTFLSAAAGKAMSFSKVSSSVRMTWPAAKEAQRSRPGRPKRKSEIGDATLFVSVSIALSRFTVREVYALVNYAQQQPAQGNPSVSFVIQMGLARVLSGAAMSR